MSAADPLSTIEQVAKDDPLAHPVAFTIAHMDYDFATPGHLVEVHQSVFKGLNRDRYPHTIRNIMRLMPREHGKSETSTHAIPSWYAMSNPDARILIMMESEQQAMGKLKECKETINRVGPQYGLELEIESKRQLQLNREETHAEPTIQAAGFGSSVTGGHYDLLIFDDLISTETVQTEARREKTWNQFQDYHNLGTEGKSTFLVIGTRKHPDDLYQKLLDSPGWDARVERAISDWSIVENGEYDVITGDGERFDASERPHGAEIAQVIPHRDVDVLWPERWPLGSLIRSYLMGSIEGDGDEQLSGSNVWIRENQNKADALMGKILSEGMLKFVDDLPGNLEWHQLPVYAAADLALEADAEKAANDNLDYFALAVACYDATTDTHYVLDCRRKRGMTMAEAISWMHRQCAQWDTRTIHIEANQAQRFFVQEALDEGLFAEEVHQTGDKEERIQTMSARFERGKAVIVGNRMAPHWDSFVSEWTQFPSADHDDRLDAMATALDARNEEDEEAKRTVRRPFVGL
jgi:predicted phage terminase large subunit-like protein